VSGRTHSTAPAKERAVLVGVARPRPAVLRAADSLIELGRLAETAGVAVAAKTAQPLRRVHPAAVS